MGALGRKPQNVRHAHIGAKAGATDERCPGRLIAAAPLRASEAYEPMLARRLEGRPDALADALEAFSPGRQPPLGKPLATCPVRALLMAGSQDAKYVASNAALAEANPAFEAATVADAGHAPQLERPDDFHDAVRRWLDQS